MVDYTNWDRPLPNGDPEIDVFDRGFEIPGVNDDRGAVSERYQARWITSRQYRPDGGSFAQSQPRSEPRPVPLYPNNGGAFNFRDPRPLQSLKMENGVDQGDVTYDIRGPQPHLNIRSGALNLVQGLKDRDPRLAPPYPQIAEPYFRVIRRPVPPLGSAVGGGFL